MNFLRRTVNNAILVRGDVSHSHSHNHNVAVHEHRAPTDESVRLLRDMEAAAEKKLVDAIHVGNTTFECVLHVERQFADDSIRLRAIFSLNGQQRAVHHLYHPKGDAHDRVDAFNKAIVDLRDAMASEIASTILSSVLDKVRCPT